MRILIRRAPRPGGRRRRWSEQRRTPAVRQRGLLTAANLRVGLRAAARSATTASCGRAASASRIGRRQDRARVGVARVAQDDVEQDHAHGGVGGLARPGARPAGVGVDHRMGPAPGELLLAQVQHGVAGGRPAAAGRARPAGAFECTPPRRSARIAAASLQRVPPEKSPAPRRPAAPSSTCGSVGGSARRGPPAAPRRGRRPRACRPACTPSTGVDAPPPTMQADGRLPAVAASARSTPLGHVGARAAWRRRG